MKNKIPKITENEWHIMRVLWEQGTSCTSTEIIKSLIGIKDVSAKTIRVMIGRLVKKGAIAYTVDEKNAALYHYFPLVTEEECLRDKSKQFQEAYFQDNANFMFATMIQHTALSEEDLEGLIVLLEQAKNQQGR